MVYFTSADAPRIQTIPFYINNPLRNLALVKENKDDLSLANVSEVCATEPFKTLSDLMDKYIPQFVDIMKDMPKGTNPDTLYNNSFTLAIEPDVFYTMEFGFGSIDEPYVEICNQIAVHLTSDSTITCSLVPAGCGEDSSQCDYVETVKTQLKDVMTSFASEVQEKFSTYSGLNLFVYESDVFLRGNLTLSETSDFTVTMENGTVECSEQDSPQSNKNIRRKPNGSRTYQ
jgi:hypothetical protein